MANIEMVIDSIRLSVKKDEQSRVVLLKEKEGPRYLPVWIGPAEADAIAVRIQEIPLPAVFTHDFACAIIRALGGSLESAIIHELVDNAFHAKVVLETEKEQKEIDCRPSDALAMAVRAGVPIFVDEEVLEKACVRLEGEAGRPSKSSSEAVSAPGQKAAKGSLDIVSEPAQGILAASEDEAKRMNCGYVCTGHLLIALTKQKNTATKFMKNAGVDLGKIQRDVKTLIEREPSVEGGGAGLTPAVKEVVQTSIAEAKRLGSKKVLPEHLLLGLLRVDNGIAANELKKSGITPEAVYAELIRLHNSSR